MDQLFEGYEGCTEIEFLFSTFPLPFFQDGKSPKMVWDIEKEPSPEAAVNEAAEVSVQTSTGEQESFWFKNIHLAFSVVKILTSRFTG